MEAIYCIFALIILLNMMQMQYLIKMQFSQLFAQNVAFFYEIYLHSSVDLKINA